jgi:hypothetical protein
MSKMSVILNLGGNATTLEIVEVGVEQSSIRDDVVNYICASDENSDYELLEDVDIGVSAADGVLECRIDRADAMELVQQTMVVEGVMFADDVRNNKPVKDPRLN